MHCDDSNALTPVRAVLAELIRRYSVLGMECSLLEVQKLSWFLQRAIEHTGLKNESTLTFEANHFGPHAHNLTHVLNALEGSFLKSDKRLSDCDPLTIIWFNDQERDRLNRYLHGDAIDYLPALEDATAMIEGFESPYGMELLATVDWLLLRGGCQPTLESIKTGISAWPTGKKWADRKLAMFNDKSLLFAIERLHGARPNSGASD